MCVHMHVEIKLCLSTVSISMQMISFNMKFLNIFPESDSIEVPEAARAWVSQTAEKPSKAELISNTYPFPSK